MRVAMVTHNVGRGDGQGTAVRELALQMVATGVAVHLVAHRVDSDVLDAGVTWHPVTAAVSRPVLLKAAFFAREAERVLAREGFEVVHAHGFVLRHPHTVNTAHYVHAAAGNLSGSPYHRLYHACNVRWERQAFRRASRVAAVSERVAGELTALGLPPEQVSVIPHGVSPEALAGPPLPRAELGAPPDAVLALFAGDLRTSRKNLDTVLHTLPSAPEVFLLVAGEVAGSPYPALARKLGVAERVAFLGHRRDLPRVMATADMLLCPSRYEPFSMVLLEAMAVGLPVVTAQQVGAAPLLRARCADPAGLVIECADDVDALGTAVRRLARDEDTRRRMGEAGCRYARELTWQRAVEAYLCLYEEARR